MVNLNLYSLLHKTILTGRLHFESTIIGQYASIEKKGKALNPP